MPALLNAASFECFSHSSEYVNCSQAVTGTTMKFTCLPGYRAVAGETSTRTCNQGTWGAYKPGCEPDPLIVPTTSTTATHATNNVDDGINVICTYASWSSYKGTKPSDFDANLCTHLYYAFAGIRDSGDIWVNDDLDIITGKIHIYTYRHDQRA